MDAYVIHVDKERHRTFTSAEIKKIVTEARHIGGAAAARRLGLSEGTVI